MLSAEVTHVIRELGYTADIVEQLTAEYWTEGLRMACGTGTVTGNMVRYGDCIYQHDLLKHDARPRAYVNPFTAVPAVDLSNLPLSKCAIALNMFNIATANRDSSAGSVFDQNKRDTDLYYNELVLAG